MDKRLLYLPSILFALAGAVSAFSGDFGMGALWLSIGVVFLTVALAQTRKSPDSQ